MTPKITLYYNILSPPSRAVLLCGSELKIEFDLKEIDLLNLEHKKPEFIEVRLNKMKINSKIYIFYLNYQKTTTM